MFPHPEFDYSVIVNAHETKPSISAYALTNIFCSLIPYETSLVCFTAYTCYGHWKSDITGVNYVIATPLGRSAPNSRRYCFIMSQVNGIAQQTLHIASVMESCHPHPLGRLHWAFNITHQGNFFAGDWGIKLKCTLSRMSGNDQDSARPVYVF